MSTTKQTTRKQPKRSRSAVAEPNERRVRRRLGRDEAPDAPELVRPSPPPDANTKGLPTLPVELHLEIITYLPSVPIPCLPFGILEEDHRVKFDTMFAISQTCRVLYHMYKPLLWETLQACALRPGCYTETQRQRALATELVLWLEVVSIRAPALASYVRVFNVALTAYSSSKVYQELTRCLQLLPNLHTLQIVSFPTGNEQTKCLRHLSDAFKGAICLPTIHTLTVPQCIFERLVAFDGPRVFPNLRHLSLTKMFTSARLKCYIADRPCHQDQEVHSLELSAILQMGEPAMLSLVSLFPHLRVTPRILVPWRKDLFSETEEEFTNRYLPKAQKVFQALSRLTRLHTIVLDCKRAFADEEPCTVNPVVMDSVCDMAERLILR